MAWTKRKYMDHHVDNYQEFVCDTVDDIANLPKNCAPGSSALVIENFTIWVIDSHGVWHNSDGSGESEGT